MTATSESTKAIEEILRREFDAEPVFDKSHTDSNLTLRVDKRRYRIYVSNEFEEDFTVLQEKCQGILEGLPFALNTSETDAVLITTLGIKEHQGRDF
jgi:hypothetical protein